MFCKIIEMFCLFLRQNQRRESAVAGTYDGCRANDFLGRSAKSEARKRCSVFEQAREFPKIRGRKTMFQNVVPAMAVSKRIFASSLTGKFCSRCLCFLQAKQSYVFVIVFIFAEANDIIITHPCMIMLLRTGYRSRGVRHNRRNRQSQG